MSPIETLVVEYFMTNILLIALSALESGHRPAAIGPAGEVSRFQVLPRVWRAHRGGNPRIDSEAIRVASEIMRERTRNESVDPKKWYLLWHCPGRVRRGTVTRKDMELAERFNALTK